MRNRFTPLLLLLVAVTSGFAQTEKPNIIFILADDLGWGELGCYGQKLIQTPHLDRMAAEGVRFTQFYAGSTVCAPSRSVLMTGQHLGHTTVRGNAGARGPAAQTLRPNEVTIAHVLKQAGYATGLVGKWGLGGRDSDGNPLRQGFDYYFGYLSQGHAHNHFPDFLWRNDERVLLPNDITRAGSAEGMGYSTNRLVYAGDLLAKDARDFVGRNRNRPFFLYYSLITPHANNERSRALGEGNEVPDVGPYADRPWNESTKNHAAMITRMDRDIGDLIAQLKHLGIDQRTLVIFTSDNGPHREGGPQYDPAFFTPSGPFSGLKRSLKEGGIRVPFIARWPGRIRPGVVSDHVGYFGDMMTTFAELAGAAPPPRVDSISIVPTLLGRSGQRRHAYLYWEFYEQGVSQAVLIEGRWKALRLRSPTGPIQLYDLNNDVAEQTDVAAAHPAIVARAAELMRTARHDNEHWSIPAAPSPSG
jgi:arylsulfatase A-like enzyme